MRCLKDSQYRNFRIISVTWQMNIPSEQARVVNSVEL